MEKDGKINGKPIFKNEDKWLPMYTDPSAEQKKESARKRHKPQRKAKSLEHIFDQPDAADRSDLKKDLRDDGEWRPLMPLEDRAEFVYFDPLVVPRHHRQFLMSSKNIAVGTMASVLCKYFDYEYNDLSQEAKEDETIYAFVLPPERWKKQRGDYPTEEEFRAWMWIALHNFIPGTYEIDEKEFVAPPVHKYWKIFYDPWPELLKEIEESNLTAKEMQEKVKGLYWVADQFVDPAQKHPQDAIGREELIKLLEKRVKEDDDQKTIPEKDANKKDEKKPEETNDRIPHKKLWWPDYIPHGRALNLLSTPTRFHYMEYNPIKFAGRAMNPNIMQGEKIDTLHLDKGNIRSRWNYERLENVNKDFGVTPHHVQVKMFQKEKHHRDQNIRQDFYIDADGEFKAWQNEFKEESNELKEGTPPEREPYPNVRSSSSSSSSLDDSSEKADSNPFRFSGESKWKRPEEVPWNDILYYINAHHDVRKDFFRRAKKADPNSYLARTARIALKMYKDEQKWVRDQIAPYHGIHIPPVESSGSSDDSDFIDGVDVRDRRVQNSPKIAEKQEQVPKKPPKKNKPEPIIITESESVSISCSCSCSVSCGSGSCSNPTPPNTGIEQTPGSQTTVPIEEADLSQLKDSDLCDLYNYVDNIKIVEIVHPAKVKQKHKCKSRRKKKSKKEIFNWYPYLPEVQTCKKKKHCKKKDKKARRTRTRQELNSMARTCRGDTSPSIKWRKDFVYHNARQNILIPPKRSFPTYIDDCKGTRHHYCTSGLANIYVHKKDYGQIPEYLKQRNEELGRPPVPDFRRFYRPQICKFIFNHFHCNICRKAHPLNKHGKTCRDCKEYDPLD